MQSWKTPVVLVFVFAAAPAWADDQKDRGLYFGVETGVALHHVDAASYNTNFGVEDPAATRVKDEFFGYAAYAGYRFFKYLSVDGGYVNLGAPEVSIGYHSGISCTGTSCVPVRKAPTRIELCSDDGLRARAVGSWPFTSRWSVDARLGFALMGCGDSGSIVGMGGVGTSLNLTPALRARLFWDQLGKRNADDEPVDFYSLGLAMQF